jgi:hypothetical protein
VAGERAAFDVALCASAPALAAQLVERALVSRVGEGKAAGEDARVAGGELTGCPGRRQ